MAWRLRTVSVWIRVLSVAVVCSLVLVLLVVRGGGDFPLAGGGGSLPISDAALLPIIPSAPALKHPASAGVHALRLLNDVKAGGVQPLAQVATAFVHAGGSIYDGADEPKVIVAGAPSHGAFYAQVGQVLAFAHAAGLSAHVPLSTLLGGFRSGLTAIDASISDKQLRAYLQSMLGPAAGDGPADRVRKELLARDGPRPGLNTALKKATDYQLTALQALLLIAAARSDMYTFAWLTHKRLASTTAPTRSASGTSSDPTGRSTSRPKTISPTSAGSTTHHSPMGLPAPSSGDALPASRMSLVAYSCEMDGVPSSLFSGIATLIGYLFGVAEKLIAEAAKAARKAAGHLPIPAKEYVGKILGIAQVMSTVLNAFATFVLFHPVVTSDAGPLVRTKLTTESGASLGLRAALRLKGSVFEKSRFVNCILRALSAVGLDASWPKEGALQQIPVDWKVVNGPATVTADSPTTDSAGLASAVLMGKPQKKDRSNGYPFQREIDVEIVAHPFQPKDLAALVDLLVSAGIDVGGDVISGGLGGGTINQAAQVVIQALDAAGAWSTSTKVDMTDWGQYVFIADHIVHSEGHAHGPLRCGDSREPCGQLDFDTVTKFLVRTTVPLESVGASGLSGKGTSHFETADWYRNELKTHSSGNCDFDRQTFTRAVDAPAVVSSAVLSSGSGGIRAQITYQPGKLQDFRRVEDCQGTGEYPTNQFLYYRGWARLGDTDYRADEAFPTVTVSLQSGPGALGRSKSAAIGHYEAADLDIGVPEFGTPEILSYREDYYLEIRNDD